MKRSSKSAKKSTSKRTTPSTDQKTLEELEQGFSPYINGANVDLPVFQKQNSNNSNRKRSTPSFSKHHDNGNTQSTDVHASGSKSERAGGRRKWETGGDHDRQPLFGKTPNRATTARTSTSTRLDFQDFSQGENVEEDEKGQNGDKSRGIFGMFGRKQNKGADYEAEDSVELGETDDENESGNGDQEGDAIQDDTEELVTSRSQNASRVSRYEENDSADEISSSDDSDGYSDDDFEDLDGINIGESATFVIQSPVVVKPLRLNRHDLHDMRRSLEELQQSIEEISHGQGETIIEMTASSSAASSQSNTTRLQSARTRQEAQGQSNMVDNTTSVGTNDILAAMQAENERVRKAREQQQQQQQQPEQQVSEDFEEDFEEDGGEGEVDGDGEFNSPSPKHAGQSQKLTVDTDVQTTPTLGIIPLSRGTEGGSEAATSALLTTLNARLKELDTPKLAYLMSILDDMESNADNPQPEVDLDEDTRTETEETERTEEIKQEDESSPLSMEHELEQTVGVESNETMMPEHSMSPQIGGHESNHVEQEIQLQQDGEGEGEHHEYDYDWQILFHITSNWGHPQFVGLTGIDLWDTAGRKVDTKQCQIRLTRPPNGLISRVLDNSNRTVDPSHMWRGNMDKGTSGVSFIITTPKDCMLSKIDVWNYNESTDKVNIGVNKLDVYLNGQLEPLWSGSVEMASGSMQFEPSHSITLKAASRLNVNTSIDSSFDDSGEHESMLAQLRALREKQQSRQESTVDTGISSSSLPMDDQDDMFWQALNHEDKDDGEQQTKPLVVKSRRDRVSRQAEQHGEETKEAEQPMEDPKPQEAGIKRESVESSGNLFEASAMMTQSESEEDDIQPEQEVEAEIEREFEKASSFEIPILPTGQVLSFNIQANHGDPYFVGMSAIEIFNSAGSKVSLMMPEHQIVANPADINVLEEYEDDPRVATNLVNGTPYTCDAHHMWLAPFSKGHDHLIVINLDEPTCISLIRIWNYNKSRIHSYRGVRLVKIMLDDQLIFHGEINRAAGDMSGSDNVSDTILFTVDDHILESIAENDVYGMEEYHNQGEDADTQEMLQYITPANYERPSTATQRDIIDGTNMDVRESVQAHWDPMGGRPMTALTPRNRDQVVQNTPYENKGQGSMLVSHGFKEESSVETETESQETGDAHETEESIAAKVPFSMEFEGPIKPFVSTDSSASESSTTPSEVFGSSSSPTLEQREQSAFIEHMPVFLDPSVMHFPSARKIVFNFKDNWGDPGFMGLTGIRLLNDAFLPIDISIDQLVASPRDMTLLDNSDPRVLDK
eukprot:TRINITY_DN4276_c0_g3_i3.p1 TRINITY_DN4276_c0_g3~~TRINITY_DN4276_c0_g3_i3.p1  ORF type:complete len:1293 (-),score=428.89 TRINITY_DN4276_c0_g3_i3:1816-5694(-)